ncbi:hypothetical protein N7U66_12970 [Lacinutrix neustonica]|uniref:Uncharacterized protein n=1 Tax=Lacinutrix neustonica TaxID=2980107 RepID=A0A9E8MVJ3_9FLAO|nr:hypothetical protein [Lacinutrix neustonica]WAC01080.1 hypothetical protein N7U66_12970 [Lacinutrix neustonica]
MKLKRIHKIKNAEITHYFCNDDIITSKFNKIYVKYKDYNCIVKLPTDLIGTVFGLFRITRRALRLDKCNVFVTGNFLIIIRKHKVYSYNLETKELKETLQLKNCRNVLHQSIGETNTGELFFGEYGNNGERKPVNVYKSIDKGLSWQVVYTFKSGEIKHVHGCYYDKYENKIWTLTGDFKKENIIMKSNLDFTENEKIGDGSQKYRAVNVFFTLENVHWIMDSPLEKSYHYTLHRKTNKITRKSLFPGPVWYLKKLEDGYYIAATSVEIGEGVLSKEAQLFVSKDLENWESVYKFPKDIFPMRYFKWGVIGFADGKQSSKSFAIHFEALKKVDGKSYICSLNE